MTIETAILDIDNQGEGKKVLTQYEPHTISIVGVNALGVNINKVKSESSTTDFLETDKGKKLMSKIKKAKALDKAQKLTEEEQAALDAEQAKAEVKEEEKVEVDPKEAEEASVEEAEAEKDKVEADAPVVEEDAENASEEAPVVEEEDAETVVEAETPVEAEVVISEGEHGEKAKSYTSSEMITAQTDILKGVHALVEKIHKAIPDASLWEITDMVYSSIYKVEDAIWSAENSEWNDIYEEVSEEVSTRVNKAKALEVAKDGSLESKLKSLKAVDPVLAAMMQEQIDQGKVNKAKALEAEEEKNKVIRAKALEQGAIDFKRIATDDNTTDNIVDAMTSLAVSDAAVHTVIAKALATASAITMGGELFGDVGSSDNAIVLSEADYVQTRAKALVDTNGGELAAAKATVRQSEDYIALYK